MNIAPSAPSGSRFKSIDYTRIEGRGDRAVVLCDRDRPEGIADLVGQDVDIDGASYTVLKVEDPSKAVHRGDLVALWITAARRSDP